MFLTKTKIKHKMLTVPLTPRWVHGGGFLYVPPNSCYENVLLVLIPLKGWEKGLV